MNWFNLEAFQKSCFPSIHLRPPHHITNPLLKCIWLICLLSGTTQLSLLKIANKSTLHGVYFAGSPANISFAETIQGHSSFFCDDFRPGNVLANAEFQMTGAVDWEFTYAAPTGFAYSPPFWLILELPEHWDNGLDDWIQNYEKVLPVFLRILKEREQAAIDRHILKDTDRLSERMLKSWETGDFWLNYAARKSWAFDMIYWAKIDRRFFGDGNLEDRLQLLTQEEREKMDTFIQEKVKEKEERT